MWLCAQSEWNGDSHRDDLRNVKQSSLIGFHSRPAITLYLYGGPVAEPARRRIGDTAGFGTGRGCRPVWPPASLRPSHHKRIIVNLSPSYAALSMNGGWRTTGSSLLSRAYCPENAYVRVAPRTRVRTPSPSLDCLSNMPTSQAAV
jgi:hypothetical protein